MKTNSEYKKLVDEALKKKIHLVEREQVQIMNLFKDVSEELKLKGIKAKKGSLNEAWIKSFKKTIDKNIQEMNIGLSKNITESVKTATEIAASTHSDFLVKTTDSESNTRRLKDMFISPSKEALSEIISGGFYKDKRGLNQRIWGNSKRLHKNIDYIIQ